jgi:uncharacterized protein YbaP (TraB family)
MDKHYFSSIFAFVALSLAAAVATADHPVSLWQVEGANNRVYLLGTIHLLRESDYPLPTAIDTAYDDVDAIVMELDMDDLDPLATQAVVNELGLITDGRSLSDLLGAETYSEAAEYAAAATIPLAMLANAEPWYAAITIDMLLLTRLGFDAALGIETQLLVKAQRDGKPVFGLETERQQMEILDGLSADAQKTLLMQTLAESGDMLETLDSVITAWRHGDTSSMEKELLDEMSEYPELLDSLVTRRNNNWVDQIEELLNDDENYLIAVGTMHLVGDIGVPAQLESRGYRITQASEPSR